MNPFHTGKLVIFQVQYTHTWNTIELIPFLFLGIMGGSLSSFVTLGLVGAIFIKLNVMVTKFRRSTALKKYPIQEVIVVAGITALISFINPYMKNNSGEIIENLLSECNPSDESDLCKFVFPFCLTISLDHSAMTASYLLFAGLLRFILTVFTFGLKVSLAINI